MTQENTQETKKVELTFGSGKKFTLDVPADDLRAIHGAFVSSDSGPMYGAAFEGTEMEGLTEWLKRFKRKEFYSHGDTVYCTSQVVSATIVKPKPVQVADRSGSNHSQAK